MSKRLILLVLASLTGLLWPAGSAAAPRPVPPIEVLSGESVFEPVPHALPSGQAITTGYGDGTGIDIRFVERGLNGEEFSEPVILSSTTNVEPPSLSVTPDGGIFGIWGIATTGATAEQAIRAPGGNFTSPQPATGCGRFVDSAAGPTGGIAVACSHRLATNPPDTVAFGTSASLASVTVTEDLVPPAYEPFMRGLVDWGQDGTIAIVSQGRDTTTNPPPTNETRRVRVTLRGTVSATAEVASATWPQEVGATRPAVLDDGTVAVGLGGSAGARMLIRPPGPGSIFAPHPLPGDGVSSPGIDAAQSIHVMSAAAEPPDRQYWTSVKPAGGEFGTPMPIPLAGEGDPYVPFDSLKVAPDGTEYALIYADDGVYATSREPGQSFSSPVRLGAVASGNPNSAVTPEGDLLVTWSHEAGPDDYRLFFSGLDKTPPVATIISFPARAKTGQALSFSGSATDSFGIASTGWKFGSGQLRAGDEVNHRFLNPGRHRVRFVAADVAGNRTVRERTLTVTGPSLKQPALKLKTPGKVRFQVLKRRGIRLVVRATPKVRLRVAIGTSRRNARLRPLRTVRVGKLRKRHVLRVKPRPRRLGKARNFRLFVEVTGRSAAGKKAVRSRIVRIRR